MCPAIVTYQSGWLLLWLHFLSISCRFLALKSHFHAALFESGPIAVLTSRDSTLQVRYCVCLSVYMFL
ncbi:hypothetical protein HanIR_Chr06g0269521 [Helianthus annuus]|nr:hypothetical protein HanIR_Chr06g0269521 [Helianthus annuus]